jgi:predicted metal-dependent hydrolase
MTRLWAVCHVDTSITFASALLDQPEEFQDLVIVHELAHLLIRDHGQYFHTLVRVFVPDGYRISRLVPKTPAEWMQSRGVRETRGVYLVGQLDLGTGPI